jgi:DNA-binding NarL/FixJ family response regulator
MKNDVLLVNMTPTVRYVVRVALEGSGFTVTKEAQTDAESLHHFESQRPAAVVFDMTLSPHERLKALRHFNKRFPTGRVLAIYSYASRPNIPEVRRAGARELVAFPFTKEGFLAALGRLVGPPEHEKRPEPPGESL